MSSGEAGGLALDEGWQIFVEHYPRMMQTYRKIARSEWFKNGHWAAFVGRYPHGIYMQIFKPHWFNQELEGIQALSPRAHQKPNTPIGSGTLSHCVKTK